MSSTPSKRLVDALAVAFELSGGPPLSDLAALAVLAKLSTYPEAAVLKALDRCASEVTGRLSLAAIIERIDDGRPTPEEAWVQVGAAGEADTIVTTEEAMRALGLVRDAIAGGDEAGARMGFREAYKRIVAENRSQGVPVRAHVSLGFDKAGQLRALTAAVQAGRLDADHAARLLGVPVVQLTGRAAQAQAQLPTGASRAPLALPAPEPPPECVAAWCEAGWHYEADPRGGGRPAAFPCPMRPR